MKILHVINSLPIGGAETLLVDMTIKMQLQHDVTVFILGGEDSFLTEKLNSANVKIIKKNKKINSLSNLYWLQKNMNNYDIVHSHLSWAQYFVSFAARTNKKCKVITTEHSTSNRRKQNPLFKSIDFLMYSAYDKIIVISDGAKKAMIKWQPQFCDKFILIENGIDIDKFKNASADLEIQKSDKIKLLMVAGFRNSKDQDTVVRALNLLDDKYELYFVGDGERRIVVEELVNELDLKSRVHFLGVRSDVAKIMKACDIFIISSHWEGFGLVAVEAMAAGLPVIGTNVNGLKEVIGNQNRLFEVENEEELVRKILENKNKRIVYNINHYDFSKTINKYIELYRGS